MISPPPAGESAGSFLELAVPGAGGSDETRAVFTQSLEPQPGIDKCWRIFTQDTYFDVEVTADSRFSRLYRKPPAAGRYFEITGLRAPPDLRMAVERWWIDLDTEFMLVGTALRRRAYSVVVEDGNLTFYDWSELDFDKGRAAAFRLARGSGGAILRRSELSGTVSPFGYLAAPAAEMGARFEPEWSQVSGYHLDWLDFSGAVETVSGRVLPLAQVTAQGCWPGSPFPNTIADGEELAVGP